MKNEMRKKKEAAEQIIREEEEEKEAERETQRLARKNHDECEYARWKSSYLNVV